jgi:hypothetical protein
VEWHLRGNLYVVLPRSIHTPANSKFFLVDNARQEIGIIFLGPTAANRARVSECSLAKAACFAIRKPVLASPNFGHHCTGWVT